MEPVVLISVGAVVGIVTITLLLMTWCNTKEADFDEALQQRKKLELALESKPKRSQKSKLKKTTTSKAVKKTSTTSKVKAAKTAVAAKQKDRKSSEESEHSTVDEAEEEHKMVQYEIEPEVINDANVNVNDLAAPIRKRKNNKKGPQKSILVNKDEKPLISEREDVQIVHADHVPRDDLEMRRFRERRDSEFSSKSAELAAELEKEIAKNVKVEKVEKVSPQEKKPGGKKEKKDKKKEGTGKLGSGDATIGNAVSPMVTPPVVQIAAKEEVVVASKQEKRQATPSPPAPAQPQKSQKTDAALQRQLQEKDHMIATGKANEQELRQRLEALHQQLLAHQQHSDMMDKQLQVKAGETQALILRLQQTHEQHLAEIGGLKQQAERGQQAEEEFKRLQKEHHELRSHVDQEVQQARDAVHNKTKMLVEQLSGATLKINTIEGGKEILERKVARLEEELKQKENQQRGNDTLNKKVKELEGHIKAKDQEINRMRAAINKADTDKTSAEKKATDAHTNEEGLKTKQEQLQSQIQDLEEKLRKALDNSKNVQQQQQAAPAEVPVQVEQQQQQNSSIDNSGVQEELDAKTKEMQELSAELESQKKKNDGFENHLKESEKQVAASKSQLAEVTSKLTTLQTEHNQKLQELANVAKQNQELQSSTGQLSETAQRSSGLFEQVQQLQTELTERDSALSKQLTENEQLNQTVAKLKESLKEMKTLEERCADISNKEYQLQQTVTSKENEMSSMNEVISTLRVQNQTLEKQKEEMVEAQIGSDEELHKEVSRLQQELADKGSSLDTASSELQALHKTCSELEDKARAQSASSQVSSDILQKTSDEVDSFKQRLSSEEVARKRAEQLLSDSEARLQELQGRQQSTLQELQEATQQLTHLHNTLQQQDTQQVQNGNLSQEVQRLKEEKDMLESSVAEQISTAKNETSEKYQALLQRLHPEVAINTASSEKEWIYSYEKEAVHHFTKQVVTLPANTSALETKLQESLEEQERLRGQVSHYHSVLSNTESILKQLQSSVDTEEQKWKEKAKLTEQELLKAHAEISKLADEVKLLKGKEEMESKCFQLEGELQDAQEKLSATQQERESFSQQQQDLVQLRTQITDQQEKIKELMAQTVKLNAQVRIGQDSLQAEQGLVTELQEELAKKSLANGTNSLTEVEELKAKLATTNKHLERETQLNKQLTQRLAAYGGFA